MSVSVSVNFLGSSVPAWSLHARNIMQVGAISVCAFKLCILSLGCAVPAGLQTLGLQDEGAVQVHQHQHSSALRRVQIHH